MSFVFNGRAWKTALEPNFQRLWDRYFSLDNQEVGAIITRLHSELSTALQAKYCPITDIAQITGIKTKS